MSNQTLRVAAALMRRRAEGANEGPWVAQRNHTGHHDIYSAPEGSARWELGGDFVPSDAAHIASWHPAVALAVADWLDDMADLDDVQKEAGARGQTAESHSVKVAAAYLGEPL